jgi:hypothetical protein
MVAAVQDAPHAPWALRGEAVGAVVRTSRLALLYGVRYTESPVGAFVELGLAVSTRLGLRPGLRSSVVVVSDAAAKVGFRLNWGLPAELGQVTWTADGDERVVRWEERGIELRAVPVGPRVPVVVPTRGIQRRGDASVLLPRRMAGLLRLARAEVSVPVDDEELGPLAGVHRGAVVASARLLLRPARQPVGALSSFRAPLREVEPGLS